MNGRYDSGLCVPGLDLPDPEDPEDYTGHGDHRDEPARRAEIDGEDEDEDVEERDERESHSSMYFDLNPDAWPEIQALARTPRQSMYRLSANRPVYTYRLISSSRDQSYTTAANRNTTR